jgi:peptidyl-prolyl cis-trans isomerase C
MSTVNGVEVPDRAAAVRELLRQRAVAAGLLDAGAGEDFVNEAIEALLEREVRTPEPDEAECRRWYDAQPEAFRSGDLVFVRHILFAVTPGVPVEALRRKAEETLHALRKDPERFAELAAELSNCPSGQQGGALGQLSRGESVPEFEREVFAGGDTGLLPRLVNTRYGFHVVAVEGRVEGRVLPFEAVRDTIALRLTATVAEHALQQYVQVLAGQAELEGVDLGAAASPLLQ